MFQFSSIEEYHSALKKGQTTCAEAVQYYLDKINSSAHLNAFVEVYGDESLIRAASLDESNGIIDKRLHGVVIGIKDVICFRNHKVTAASKILEGFTSLYSATAVQRLLDEGAIVIGSLNCDEFAMGSTNENSAYGRVLNALDENRVPGGSSGGSAVAVQAGLCMASLGSDTGGSVRQPADFCGIVGLKPSYGRISRYGLIAYASSFDQIGIFSNTIKDAALILEVMAGVDDFDSTVSSLPVPAYASQLQKEGPYRIACLESALTHKSLDPEISNTIQSRLQELRDKGHTVDAVAFNLIDYVVPAYYVLTTAEASSNLSRYDGIRYGQQAAQTGADLTTFYKQNRSAGFGIEVKRRIMLGTFVLSSGYFDAYFTKAQQVRRLISEKLGLIFRNYDVIVLPTSPVTAFPFGKDSSDPIALYLADIYTVIANLAGLPAISLPQFRHSNGMPFGLQVMANRFDEVSLLQLSAYLMEQFPRD